MAERKSTDRLDSSLSSSSPSDDTVDSTRAAAAVVGRSSDQRRGGKRRGDSGEESPASAKQERKRKAKRRSQTLPTEQQRPVGCVPPAGSAAPYVRNVAGVHLTKAAFHTGISELGTGAAAPFLASAAGGRGVNEASSLRRPVGEGPYFEAAAAAASSRRLDHPLGTAGAVPHHHGLAEALARERNERHRQQLVLAASNSGLGAQDPTLGDPLLSRQLLLQQLAQFDPDGLAQHRSMLPEARLVPEDPVMRMMMMQQQQQQQPRFASRMGGDLLPTAAGRGYNDDDRDQRFGPAAAGPGGAWTSSRSSDWNALSRDLMLTRRLMLLQQQQQQRQQLFDPPPPPPQQWPFPSSMASSLQGFAGGGGSSGMGGRSGADAGSLDRAYLLARQLPQADLLSLLRHEQFGSLPPLHHAGQLVVGADASSFGRRPSYPVVNATAAASAAAAASLPLPPQRDYMSTRDPSVFPAESVHGRDRLRFLSSSFELLPHNTATIMGGGGGTGGGEGKREESPPHDAPATAAAGLRGVASGSSGMRIDDCWPPPAALEADGHVRRLPTLLARPEDVDKLSGHQVLLRHQIEVFQATRDDIETHTRGRNKPISIRQVGIRCRHCSHLPVANRTRGSTYFPASLVGLYQAAQNMSATHMQTGLCSAMPDVIKAKFAESIATKSSGSGAGRPYWAESAKQLGLVDTDRGMFFVRDQ